MNPIEYFTVNSPEFQVYYQELSVIARYIQILQSISDGLHLNATHC